MSKPSWILLAAPFLLWALSTPAQEKPATAGQGDNTNSRGTGTITPAVRAGSGGGLAVGVGGGVIGGLIGPGSASVRGVPFSADVIQETDQFLADGNHIHRETHGKIFRDSEGRTRNELELELLVAGKPKVMIHIVDPVENTMIMLDPEQKTASVHRFGKFAVPPLTEPRPVRPVPAPGEGGAAGVVHSTLSNSRQLQGTHEDLGVTEIEGFSARGIRFVTTVAAGAVGNDKPMTNTRENWYSDDLKTELLTKSESPQSGTHVRRLVNIQTGDPDPLLFQVPPDYTVKELPQR